MLFCVFYYLVAAILLFQGTQLLGERRHPMGVVPQELADAPRPALFWGLLLVIVGGAAVLLGLANQIFGLFDSFLRIVLGLGLALMGLYGLKLILGPKIAYQAASSAEQDHH